MPSAWTAWLWVFVCGLAEEVVPDLGEGVQVLGQRREPGEHPSDAIGVRQRVPAFAPLCATSDEASVLQEVKVVGGACLGEMQGLREVTLGHRAARQEEDRDPERHSS